MLNRPPPHTDTEILSLVEEFAASYRPGVTILTAWLRQQAPRINGLLDAGWKWSEIAAILTRAGVIYGTGKPWTVPVLNRRLPPRQAAAQTTQTTLAGCRRRAGTPTDEPPAPS